MHLEYESLRRLGRFSLDDPEAGRKLVENLDRRRVRIQVVEMCWHFGYPFPSEAVRSRVKAFLDGLCAKGEMVQPVGGLYCRPDMTSGSASVVDAVKKLVGLRELQRQLKARAAEQEPPSPPRPRKVRERPAPPPALKSVPLHAPAPVEPPLPAQPPAPKPRQVTGLQRQTEWILVWLRAQGGTAPKAAAIDAALAAGIIAASSDLDVPLQHLYNRTRAYLKGHQLILTQFGEREAEYLHLRRDALGLSTDGA
ncbi:MAG TPA: hypothetical protein VL283_01055 [Candidatus Baltobacteraceae bacterium]|nr:hypothetical protein [Candidatus Baltobacteraceae bacterium]